METVSSMFSYLFMTPTGIFCVLNLMIGTIYITSRISKLHNNGVGDQPQHYHQDMSRVNYSGPPRQQLTRAPSLLDRVKSFNFSSYLLPDHPAETQYPDTHEVQEQKVEEMMEVLHHDDNGIAMGRSKSDVTSNAGAPVERMKKSASEKAVVVGEKEKVVVVDRRTQQEAEMSRERRERRSRTAAARTAVGEDEAVDEKADDFINRFRQQLKLQRLDSILRYRELLNRGAGR